MSTSAQRTASRPQGQAGSALSGSSPPSIASVSPATAARNTTVSLVITGSYFQPGQTGVVIRNASGSILNTTTITDISTTRINATIRVPPGAWIGNYNVNITTLDGGSVPGTGRFAVTRFPAPAITTVSPASASRNTTVSFTITGSNFQPGLTSIVFRNASGAIGIVPDISGITATGITGFISIPANAPAGAWNVNITTADGGSVPGTGRFSVTAYPAPAITTISPASGNRNTTVCFTITGSNFQPGLTSVAFRNASGKILAVPAISSIAATSITGSIAIPANATAGAWNVNITTADGGSVPGTGKFTVNKYPAPAILTVTPQTVYRDTTATFEITGSNFEPGQTTVNLTRGSDTVILAVSSCNATVIRGTAALAGSTVTGLRDITVHTADGGNVTKIGAVTVL
jgi:large repetitive protein